QITTFAEVLIFDKAATISDNNLLLPFIFQLPAIIGFGKRTSLNYFLGQMCFLVKLSFFIHKS
ncbi:MAG: hypothetical protein VX032_12460, partial [SAR324 cluster bacterium]|nr:hypothetical protein [SAR324 cluster bacterium]